MLKKFQDFVQTIVMIFGALILSIISILKMIKFKLFTKFSRF